MKDNKEGIWGRSSIVGGEHYVLFHSQYSESDTIDGMLLHGVRYKLLYRGCSDHEVTQPVYLVNASDASKPFVIECMQNPEDIILLGACDRLDRRPAIAVPMNKGDLGYTPNYLYAQNLGNMQQTYEGKLKGLDDWFKESDSEPHYFTIK